MATDPIVQLSPSDYLAFERAAEIRHELVNGQIYAMSGASRPHNLITTNLTGELRAMLKGRPCEVYSSDMRVKVDETGLYTYPDVVVACGEPHFEDEVLDTLTNPVLVVEVLSPSSEGYDRGAKFEHYRRLPSLAGYLLVAQTKPHVELFRRLPEGGWRLSEASGLEATIELPDLAVTLALAEVYDKVPNLGPPL
jgi:Uma2 family endonuclease